MGFDSVKGVLERSITVSHGTYGTHESLANELTFTFKRITFAVRFFCVTDAILALDRVNDQEVVSFGVLLPVLEQSADMETIKNTLPIFGYGLSSGSVDPEDNPFLILIRYVRLVYGDLQQLDPSLNDTDDYESLVRVMRVFQASREGLTLGSCDIRT